MVQRFYKIIVVFCLAAYGPALFAQEIPKAIPQVMINSPVPLIKYSIRPGWKSTSVKEVNERKFGQVAENLKNHAATASISGNFYTEHFGIVCKKELQLEKSTRVPFRFRLGSLDYCNYLERVAHSGSGSLRE